MKAVAYYSAEYAIDDRLSTYAGGLGVLAGDIVREAGAQDRDLVAFGLAYRRNVAVKSSSNDKLDDLLMGAGFELLMVGSGPQLLEVDFGDWQVQLRVWQRAFGKTRLVYFDSDVEVNSPINRNLTANLYDPDIRTRLLQQFILAAASLEYGRQQNFSPEVYHLNEGHMAFVAAVLALEAARANQTDFRTALAAVRPRIVATKHTILAGAGDFADRQTIGDLFGSYFARYGAEVDDMFELGAKHDDPDTFSTTAFMLAAARTASAVSVLHAAAEKQAHAASNLLPITNGVHVPHWQQPNLVDQAATASDAELWRLHMANKTTLIEQVNQTIGARLDPEVLTVVWARRFATYKRPLLIFTDPQRLAAMLADSQRPMQLIVSGNANESDVEGMKILEQMVRYAQDQGFGGRMVYLPHYVTETTRVLAGGADLWINTPLRGMEACGTSGMKAGLNGAAHLSTMDGWIDEVAIDKVGWPLAVENSAEDLYKLLEQQVAPLYYERSSDGLPAGWVAKLRASIRLIEEHYSAERMLGDYYDKLYFPKTEK